MSPEPVRLVGLLYDRWRHHLPPHPQFRHETGREVNILRSPAPAVSAGDHPQEFQTHFFYRARTPCVFGGYLVASGIEPMPSGLDPKL
ncbi:hypothetical protein TNCV_849101 [Trichonephila clavipes]|uniref:Uncharacterized protein n=1 Tax=Trichonephila clavipes TaxID=2585209 RepID=A0A8X6RJI2_TRICX|nr:hypothetical protein TNCV_849101 [Trichonephila clavipes]